MKEKGFSLIEVLLSILLLSIGIIAIISAYSSYIQANNKSKVYTIELALTRDKMEECMADANPSSSTATITYENMGEGYTFVVGTQVEETYALYPDTTPVYNIEVWAYKISKGSKNKGVRLIALREK